MKRTSNILGILLLVFGVGPTLVILISNIINKEWTNSHRGIVYLTGFGLSLLLVLVKKIFMGNQIKFLPRGNITIISKQEVSKVNKNLASAKCPSCRSARLLWYQYSHKCLESGTPIYIRCQNCGHDDYTDL